MVSFKQRLARDISLHDKGIFFKQARELREEEYADRRNRGHPDFNADWGISFMAVQP
jgi:hypothetical protein